MKGITILRSVCQRKKSTIRPEIYHVPSTHGNYVGSKERGETAEKTAADTFIVQSREGKVIALSTFPRYQS